MNQENVASVAYQPIPHAHMSLFAPSQSWALSDGQTLFNCDVEGQKSFSREEWLPGVEKQLKACNTAVEFLAEAADFPQETQEDVESDDGFLGYKPRPAYLAHTTIPLT